MPAEPDADRHPTRSGAEWVAVALDALRGSWGIEFPAARTVLRTLAAGQPQGVADLVEEAGLARRRVLDILRTLEVPVHSDDPVVLEPDVAAAVSAWLGRAAPPGGRPGDRWDDLAAQNRELAEQLSEIARRLPPSRWHLDHVPATPATMAKRALYLTSAFALDGAHVLCVGDHDLTSLAVTLAEPTARATVVDVDERLMTMIDTSAREFGLDVTCARADLRLALPASLAGSADLAFTDPPYTPAGIELFVRRGLEGLRRTGPSRVLFCYGFGDRTASRAVEIQELLTRLGLAFEAVHPDFNAYRGAEAIGSRSHLYVARPTRTTWPAVDRRRHRVPSRIYTRGRDAEERGETALSRPALAAVARTGDRTALTLVGGGWPDAGLDPAGTVQRLSLDQYLSGERRPSGTVAVNLFPEFGAALIPALLAAPSGLVVVVSTGGWRASGLGRPEAATGTLLRAAFEFTVILAGDQQAETVVQALRRREPPGEPVAALHRYLVRHPTAKVVNAWREGLVHVAAAAGVTLTKNQARQAVAETGPGGSLERLRLGELPLHLLGHLAECSARSVRGVLGEGAAN